MPSVATWMDPEIILLSKAGGDRQISHDITYMRNLKCDANELTYARKTDS